MTAAAAEELIALLDNERADETLTVPTKGRHLAAGAEGAFVQALATWGNRAQPATLKTYASGAGDVQLERLVSRLYGLVSIILADAVQAKDGSDLTAEFRQLGTGRLDALQVADPRAESRGPQIEVLCADHLARSFPASLYDVDEDGVASVKRLPAFNTFVTRQVLGATIPAELRQALRPGTAQALGTALHELFRNTDEHGRGDDRGNVRRKSVRGVHARRHAITPEALAELAASSKPLADFCERLMPARANNAQVQLIELAVFDSGPGLAASLTGEPLGSLGFDRELESTIACFGKSVSRKQSSSSGLGLPNIIDALRRQRGFLRLRTGRTALYCDLSIEPNTPFGVAPALQHWFGGGGQVPYVVGSLFTLLFPLEI
ncbi:MAG: class I SAM-dependent methyltransferase [Caulobacteraceae bacterium]